MRARQRRSGYKPLTWDPDSKLSTEEQQAVEVNRRDLFDRGIKEPHLTKMAFEFGAVQCTLRKGTKP